MRVRLEPDARAADVLPAREEGPLNLLAGALGPRPNEVDVRMNACRKGTRGRVT
ncbi:hypothetical protein ABZ318_25130 [Streptomyces sp. NPDC006197]|uniref:hypothetical protein n=1 Tax=Streptomyces sp. NPDC006197 TaxID=3156685 RepID=UPI00339F9C14